MVRKILKMFYDIMINVGLLTITYIRGIPEIDQDWMLTILFMMYSIVVMRIYFLDDSNVIKSKWTNFFRHIGIVMNDLMLVYISIQITLAVLLGFNKVYHFVPYAFVNDYAIVNVSIIMLLGVCVFTVGILDFVIIPFSNNRHKDSNTSK